MDFVITEDGSKTIFNAQIGEHYHSKHGAAQESRHVFLKSGLHYFLGNRKDFNNKVSILEVGFGTGLNFLLTAEYCAQQKIDLYYTGVEAYPLTLDTIRETDYHQLVSPEIWKAFLSQYESLLSNTVALADHISLEIAHQLVMEFKATLSYDIIYFDAFAAANQPEMWNMETLSHVSNFLKPGGIFVTYAITGNLKRAMKSLGFSIEKIPGAPGKREMLRATKALLPLLNQTKQNHI